MARQRDYCLREVLPFTALVSVECTNVGMNTLYKAVVANGLNFHVYMAYAYAISSIVLLPLAFLFHRNTPLPPFSMILLGKFFILGFIGFSGQYVGNLGIKYSNPTMASAMSSIAPACTFFLAIIFRMEKVKLTSMSSQAKVMGALGKFVREYPAEFILVFFYNFFAMVLAVPIGIASEPHLSSWKVPLDVRFFSILYAGIMGSGYGIMIHIWGLHVKGPVYVALFRPLSIAIAAILGVIFLGDDLSLGTVIGSVIITMGFYTVVWGKHKEEETSDASSIEDNIETFRTDVPLLKHRQNSGA
ncbi:hypothetical protein ACS0TY_034769 [Phlomoides rotata]